MGLYQPPAQLATDIVDGLAGLFLLQARLGLVLGRSLARRSDRLFHDALTCGRTGRISIHMYFTSSETRVS